MAEDATRIYGLYDVPLDPKWFPVFYILSEQEASITEIAQAIGHSHPSVSQIVKEMKVKGLVTTGKSTGDARVNVVRLSEQGKQVIPKITTQYQDVTQAVEELLSEAQNDLWKAIEEVEFLLDNKSFLDRVRQIRKIRESEAIKILDYTPDYQQNFKQLNCAWIEKYFILEDADYESLDHPDKKILQPGGHIYLAQYNGEIVGTCALIKMTDDTFELAKMAVSEEAQGKGIGWQLGQAAITKARELGAKTLYLESSTILEPAIKLYQKLGFRKVTGRPTPYKRCNIQMELSLKD
ncbi:MULTISPECIES: bifunctional helix-turn-helix transcriptional regulator/GNAT family N-acetyltransferase [unclassified Leptolyngbya]|uniref:bifunctional helix-turn-helix transcriptional regulator/GNAT family N-acetyltransferase n=1 Tax=unclassified Leptolyngbya TaxID=2650499 RepID=UPI001F54CFBA|nr:MULTISPECIES: bifunctional helix-turn-helix transcriptional regulator/GNAT family N-acetyltransferase [unclassified Leptolyngbya]